MPTPMPTPLLSGETIHYQQEVARLQALLEASRRIHGALHIDDVLHCVLEIAVKEMEAEGAFFTESPALERASRIAYGNVPLDPGEWSRYPNFELRDKLGRLLTNLIVVRPDEPLDLEEQDFLEGLALQSSVALETARQHERTIAWERVQQDLASARAIQRSLLPQHVPEIPGYSVDFRSNACYEVGGDYVDVLKLPDGRYVMIVADVAGKGLASAIVAASFRSAFRAMAITGLPLDELAERIGGLHYAEGLEARRRYVTAIILRLDPASHSLECLNAGHTSGFLIDGQGEHHPIESSGTPLGILPDIRYTVEQFNFGVGSRLLFYTDGLSETSCGEEEFGEERLLDSFRGCAHSGSGASLDHVWQELNTFSNNARPSDDMTALALFRIQDAQPGAKGISL